MLYEKMARLKFDYEQAVKNYVEFFCIKQQLEFDYWVADQIGTVANFGDYWFNLEDIRYDIDKEIDANTIMEWQNYAVEHESKVNYSSYVAGARWNQLRMTNYELRKKP